MSQLITKQAVQNLLDEVGIMTNILILPSLKDFELPDVPEAENIELPGEQYRPAYHKAFKDLYDEQFSIFEYYGEAVRRRYLSYLASEDLKRINSNEIVERSMAAQTPAIDALEQYVSHLYISHPLNKLLHMAQYYPYEGAEILSRVVCSQILIARDNIGYLEVLKRIGADTTVECKILERFINLLSYGIPMKGTLVVFQPPEIQTDATGQTILRFPDGFTLPSNRSA
jgi:hypothetical protein